jgi:hypothetical protein
MSRTIRLSLLVFGGVLLILTAGFFLQAPWATGLWPVRSGRLSNIFVSSILIAIAAPVIWIAIADERRALAGGAINIAVTSAGMAFAAFGFFGRSNSGAMLAFAIAATVIAVSSVIIFFYNYRTPFRDQRLTPVVVRLAFAAFAIILALVGYALVSGRPYTFPWPTGRENAVFYGYIFLGAMCYFIYGLVFPRWGNARGQLLGFLAYDLILIVPFVRYFDSVSSIFRTSLVIYATVVTVSGLLAIYFLFLHPATRFGGRAPAANLP